MIDAVMMGDFDRGASLFTPDAVVRIPHIGAELAGREAIRAGAERLQALWEFFVQTTHPGTIRLDGDTATGRAYVSALMHGHDGLGAPCSRGRRLTRLRLTGRAA